MPDVGPVKPLLSQAILPGFRYTRSEFVRCLGSVQAQVLYKMVVGTDSVCRNTHLD